MGTIDKFGQIIRGGNSGEGNNHYGGGGPSSDDDGLSGCLGAIVFFVVLFFVFGGGGTDKNSKSTADKTSTTYSDEVIRDFLSTEDTRNIESIMSFYAPTIERYWNLSYPTHEEVREQYYASWDRTIYTENEVLSIEKTGRNSYVCKLKFKYSSKGSGTVKEKVGKVYFSLSDGKIIESYGM